MQSERARDAGETDKTMKELQEGGGRAPSDNKYISVFCESKKRVRKTGIGREIRRRACPGGTTHSTLINGGQKSRGN